MRLTEVRINLCPGSHPFVASRGDSRHRLMGVAGECAGHTPHASRLRAFCSITLDDAFVVRDVKLIEGNEGLFLAMPSRKLTDHCPGCGEKNHLRARYCNQCGSRLAQDRCANHRPIGAASNGGAARLKLHADVAHPISARCRQELERRVIEGYWREVELSKQPGYVPPSLDGEDFELPDARLDRIAQANGVHG